MAIDSELLRFVRESLAEGVSRDQIQEALRRAGWSDGDIQNAVASYAEIAFPVPVPRPKAYLSPREAFLYLVLFSTLYVSAYNLGSLLFQFIDIAFPDPAETVRFGRSGEQAIRWAVAHLVIAFPVFLYVSRLLNRAVREDPGKRASKVRKWLTYMTLFIAASVIIGDLTTLVYTFLEGELSWRFILKVLTVGTIAGVIFGYYLSDLRQEEAEAGA